MIIFFKGNLYLVFEDFMSRVKCDKDLDKIVGYVKPMITNTNLITS